MLFNIKIQIILCLLLLLPSALVARDMERLRKDFLDYRVISEKNFEETVLHLEWVNPVTRDSLVDYRNWLMANKQDFLSGENPYFNIIFYLELSRVTYANNNHRDACKYIDSTFRYFTPGKFPLAFLKINTAGAQVAKGKRNYTKSNQYLGNIVHSGLFKNDSSLLGNVYLQMAENYLNIRQYDKSLFQCSQAYPLLNHTKKSSGMIRLLFLMYENSHFTSSDVNKTTYLHKAADLAFMSGDSALTSDTYFYLGKAFYREGKYAEAIKNYIIARDFIPEKGSLHDIEIAVFQFMSSTYLPNSVEKACELSDYILQKSLEHNYVSLLSNAYLARAYCFAKQGIRDSAELYLDLSEKYCQLYGKLEVSPGFYFKMHEVSQEIQNYQRALKYLNKSLEESRRINRENNTAELNRTRALFDYEEQKTRIVELEVVNQLEREKNLRQQFMLSGICAILLTFAAFFIYARQKYLQIKLSHKNLVRKNIELDNLNQRLTEAENNMHPQRKKTVIKDEDLIYKKLKFLFEKETVFKEQDLSLQNLAERLNTNTTYLSYIINSRFNCSFRTLLNNYRIKEARRLLISEEYANFSIEGIAIDVGYPSRSTFYQVFRQVTGLTPTEYLENYRKMDKKKEKKSEDDESE
jgi:AraC-like DNA-binding protein